MTELGKMECTAGMIRAILAGRKTQTRRLATSPLRKCEPGDLLWVREGFTTTPVQWHGGPTSLFYAADISDTERAEVRETHGVRWTPSIHMPRLLRRMQRWCNYSRRAGVTWEEYDASAKTSRRDPDTPDLFATARREAAISGGDDAG